MTCLNLRYDFYYLEQKYGNRCLEQYLHSEYKICIKISDILKLDQISDAMTQIAFIQVKVFRNNR